MLELLWLVLTAVLAWLRPRLEVPPPVAVRISAPRSRVLVFIAHGWRELVDGNVTANPTAAWVWRQLIEATPWGNKPRHLLRDRDAVHGRDSRQRARRMGNGSDLQAAELRPHSTAGPIRSRPVLNGLHHVYERAA